MKKGLITGITGQDGSYLAELLLKKNYQVIGMVSQKNDIGGQNINHFKNKLVLESGDLLDQESINYIIKKHQPNEIYNLAGITFVPFAWEKPEFTFNVNTLGVLKILQAIVKFSPKSKMFQATSAKIFGNPLESPQTENTAIRPFGPYGMSKACAHMLVQSYRSHFNLFCCSGIMYNHESERRGVEFVTRKITYGAVRIKLGLQKYLTLGNLGAKQDWGYAPDYVEAIWQMLQAKTADDFIIASGKMHAVSDVCKLAFSYLGLDWKKYVMSDPNLVRKEEEHQFYGDISKIKNKIGWQPKTNFATIIKKMIDYDLQLAKEALLR